MYAHGIATHDNQSPGEIRGIEVSPTLISNVSEKVLEEVPGLAGSTAREFDRVFRCAGG